MYTFRIFRIIRDNLIPASNYMHCKENGIRKFQKITCHYTGNKYFNSEKMKSVSHFNEM